jgi:hypothetical protein
MGKVFDAIDESMREWLRARHMFFVATAPLSGDGLVNLSPKGLDSFAVLDPRRVAYLDLTGSGIETIAHLRENGRIVLMFCAFDGPPRIVRFHGRGEVFEAGAAGFDELAARFPQYPSARAVIRVDVSRIADSCGYGVPLYRYEAERDHIGAWASRKGADGMREYRAANNARSLDGLPGLGEGNG